MRRSGSGRTAALLGAAAALQCWGAAARADDAEAVLPQPMARDGKYGFLGRDGVFVIAPQFDAAAEFSGGLAAVGRKTGHMAPYPEYGPHCLKTEMNWWFIDTSGKIVIELGPSSHEPGPLSDGVARFWKGGRAGFVDARGKVIVSPRFENAGDFSEGVAGVSVRRRWGYVDKKGRFVLPAKFGGAEPFHHGIAEVWSEDDKTSPWIDKNGRPVAFWKPPIVSYQDNPSLYVDTRITLSEFSEDLAVFAAPVGREMRKGYVGMGGAPAIPAIFEEAYGFAEGLAAVKSAGRWGFIDRGGRFVIAPRFEGVLAEGSSEAKFRDGLAAVKVKGKWGFVDRTGQLVIAPAFDEVRSFSEDLAAVCIGARWGYADKTGRIVVPPTFTAAGDFSEGLAAARDGGLWGFVDRRGWAIRPTFAGASAFHGGLAGISVRVPGQVDEERMGFIDRSGNLVIPPVLRSAEAFRNGYTSAYDAVFDQSQIIDRTGKVLFRPRAPEASFAGRCRFPPASAAMSRYRASVRIDSEPRGAQVYLVPLWDWESSGDGRALLADPQKLAFFRVPEGPTDVRTVVRRQVYVAVLELDGQRKVQKVVITENDNQVDVALR